MDVFLLASWIGGIAFAFSGFIVGVRKNLDVMGIFILSMLTANGGGAVRDMLVNKTPWVLTDLSGFYMVVIVMAAAMLFRLHHHADKIEKSNVFILSDGLGLTAFSVTGALVGIEAELSVFGVMVLAFITASGGGIIRDVIVNEVPTLLSSDFYGTISLFVGAGIYVLYLYDMNSNLMILMLFLFALLLRLIAYLCKWRLPRIKC